jgi:hypothetical protein
VVITMTESATHGQDRHDAPARLRKDGAPVQVRTLRIGTAERDRAAAALAEHFSAGRLDAMEFDERTRAAYAARTVTDLEPLFLDLPAPHPPRPVPENPREAAWADGRAARESYAAGGIGHPRRYPADRLRLALLVVFVLACSTWVALTRVPPFFVFPLFWLVIMRRPWPRRHRYR